MTSHLQRPHQVEVTELRQLLHRLILTWIVTLAPASVANLHVAHTPILQGERLEMLLCLILTTYPAYHNTLLSLKKSHTDFPASWLTKQNS